jgi:hypothetical protein
VKDCLEADLFLNCINVCKPMGLEKCLFRLRTNNEGQKKYGIVKYLLFRYN